MPVLPLYCCLHETLEKRQRLNRADDGLIVFRAIARNDELVEGPDHRDNEMEHSVSMNGPA